MIIKNYCCRSWYITNTLIFLLLSVIGTILNIITLIRYDDVNDDDKNHHHHNIYVPTVLTDCKNKIIQSFPTSIRMMLMLIIIMILIMIIITIIIMILIMILIMIIITMTAKITVWKKHNKTIIHESTKQHEHWW